MSKQTRAIVFDAYGTLFDVHSIARTCETRWPEQGTRLSQLWRSKQLEYTWLRSLMGCYVDFETLTVDALRYACRSLGLELGVQDEDMLLDIYRRLTPFRDAEPVLEALRAMPLAILSNGSPAMLESLVRASGFHSSISLVLSVDALRTYKPTPTVYQLAADALALPPSEIGFVSANCWDACGAKSFGFRTFWVNRTHVPMDILGASPDHVVENLHQLAVLLSS